MDDHKYLLRGTKAALLQLTSELNELGAGALNRDPILRRAPADEEAHGQIELWEVLIWIGNAVAGGVVYDGAKRLIDDFAARDDIQDDSAFWPYPDEEA